MQIKSDGIVKEINRVWPSLIRGSQDNAGHIWIPDAIYWCPREQEVEKLLSDTFMEQYKWTKEIFDCDTFSLVLNAFVAQERYVQMENRKLSEDEWFEWSFFQCWGTKFQGESMHHAINGCLTSNRGIVLIEPQNDQMWRANNEKDHVYYISF